MLKLDSNTFKRIYRDIFKYGYQKNGDTLEIDSVEYDYSLECEKEYGLDDYSLECKKCQNCLKCKYDYDTEICLECPRYDMLYI